jgi:hypothetical protein
VEASHYEGANTMADEKKTAAPAPKAAQFKVLRPIELNGVLYLPEGTPAPKKPKSAGNGADVKVDVSGIIDLTPEQAAEMTLGQVKAVSTQQSAVSKKKKADS